MACSNIDVLYDVAYIENLQKMDEEVFYAQHDKQFDETEKHLKHFKQIKKDRRDRYPKLKCSPSQQIQYAQKIVVKRANEKLKKLNDTYARNRINLRQAVQQESRSEDDEIVYDVLVKDAYWQRMGEEGRSIDAYLEWYSVFGVV